MNTSTVAHAREVVAASIDLKVYLPEDADAWEKQMAVYSSCVGKSGR